MHNKFGVEVPAELTKTHQKHENRHNFRKWNYCELDQFGQPESVYCKDCGEKVVGLRAWGDPEVKEVNDERRTLVVRQKYRVMPYDNYSMVMLKMDDGSAHLTVACKDCANAMADASAEKLHDAYVSDLQSLSEVATTKRDMNVVAKMHTRKPVEVL